MRKIKYLGVLSGSLALLSPSTPAGAIADEFAIIAQKNVFRLNPPMRQAEHAVPPPELPQVGLLGVTTILGPRLALLKIQTKTATGTTEVSYILSEGQPRDGVIVNKIDVGSGTVWLTNHGAERILKIKE